VLKCRSGPGGSHRRALQHAYRRGLRCYAVQTCEAGMTQTGAFGAWLRSCRQSAGLSQEALAGCAGLSVRAVRNLERGRTGPHSGSLHRLADALELRGEPRTSRQ
jgi:ribosome-binding protein aMBF1 (putative translation factor)